MQLEFVLQALFDHIAHCPFRGSVQHTQRQGSQAFFFTRFLLSKQIPHLGTVSMRNCKPVALAD